MNWMILPFKRYFDFSGRSRRREFWMFALLNLIVMLVLSVLVFSAIGAAGLEAQGGSPDAILGLLTGGMGLVLMAWVLVTIIPNIAVTVRRFHDRDMSGWWYLGVVVGSLLPIIGILVSIAFIVLMALPGTPGPNRFGPDPKSEGEAATFA